MITPTELAPYGDYSLADAVIPELGTHERGKVRDIYDLPGGRRILIASDRVSAFDQNLAVIPFKGQVLTQIARFWFDATRDVCANHVIEYLDPNVLVCKRLRMMPVEVVVRDYLAGTTSTSILQMYRKGERTLYGIAFPDGLRDNQKLPESVLTPTTKAAHGAHDEPLSAQDVVARGLLSSTQWQDVSRLALALFARGRELAGKRGLILVDTKYEFGFDEDGGIVLADEVHTPDSSRYWLAATYAERCGKGEPPDTLDKDLIRRWVSQRCDPYKDTIPQIPAEVILQAAATYIGLYETITGAAFALPAQRTPVLARIRENLEKYFERTA
jgi:phosphoribosylaminoimidazole-succinocarboxamide synthase